MKTKLKKWDSAEHALGLKLYAYPLAVFQRLTFSGRRYPRRFRRCCTATCSLSA